jgi:hypothetical protein
MEAKKLALQLRKSSFKFEQDVGNPSIFPPLSFHRLAIPIRRINDPGRPFKEPASD